METRLILFHGSNHHFDEVDLSKSKNFRDFGRGFYTTTSIKNYESEEWLIMVQKNRTLGGIQHNFDIVQGPVANDKTARTIALFIAGIINVNDAIERLRSNRINNQVSLHTLAALSHLKITGKHQK